MNQQSNEKRTCCVCESKLHGRSDKVFCNIKCKNKYHSEIRQKTKTVSDETLKKLNRNYQILCFLQGEKGFDFEVSELEMIKLGFQFSIVSGYEKEPSGIKFQIYEFQYSKEKNGVLKISCIESQSDVSPFVYRRWKKVYQNALKI